MGAGSGWHIKSFTAIIIVYRKPFKKHLLYHSGWMKALSETDNRILALLKDYPQGLALIQIQKAIGASKQNAYRYMKKLEKKGDVRESGKLYFLVVSSKSFTIQSQKKKPKRPHAIQVNAKLYRTSAGRLRDTLTYLNMPYKPLLKGNIAQFEHNGHKASASKTWLYTHVELPIAPLNVSISEIQAKAIREIAPWFEAFLQKTGLRCLRDLEGNLLLTVRYWEDGYPSNEIAEQSLKDKNRIIYAIDRATGSPKAWADKSIDPFEFETNSVRIDNEMTTMLQAIEDGELKPYENEMLHREQESRIWNTLEAYGQKLSMHIPVLEKMDKVLELDIKLKEAQLRRASHPPKAKPDSSRQVRL